MSDTRQLPDDRRKVPPDELLSRGELVASFAVEQRLGAAAWARCI